MNLLKYDGFVLAPEINFKLADNNSGEMCRKIIFDHVSYMD